VSLPSLFVKEPASARFVVGGVAEAESLLGAPLPPLPWPDVEQGRAVLPVNHHGKVKNALHRFVVGLLVQTGVDLRNVPAPSDPKREQADFEALLERALRSVYESDRRLGLANLFWLAHSREVAAAFRELETKLPGLRRSKHALQPLLASFYRRLDVGARRAVDQSAPGRMSFLGGPGPSPVLDAVLDDGIALFEYSITELDLTQFLYANKRYKVTVELFNEFTNVLAGELERRLREGDRGLQSRISRHVPGLSKEQQLMPGGLLRLAMHPQLQAYLMADAWGTAARLAQSPRLRAEAEKRKSSELVDALLDLCTGLRRFELIDQARSRILPVSDMDDRVRDGRRVYEFGESAHVVNNAVNATVLFLDLRGFTQTSEGQVSARDLTEELYTVFDTFVPHVRRFGGTVDKFLGDGIMATYGTEQRDPLGPLNALRSAILCQEELIRLRRQGRTNFKMGVSVHYGRVYVARFIADDHSAQVTVIGRNVNVAGRLSSAAKKPMDEDEGDEPAPTRHEVRDLQVTVDKSGALLNEGIALSRDGLNQLEAELPLVRHDSGTSGVLDYFDEAIGRRLLIRYAGDAKFKGVRTSYPVFEVDFVR
jgi:class 3 adenylate cyclase